jgi:conjugal transfer pilus assembly protein TraE
VRLDLFLQKTSNIVAENRLLKFVVVCIGLMQLVNSYMVYETYNSQRVVLVPPDLKSRVEISGREASDEYVKEITRYALGLALSYSPATARAQFDELLALYTPEAFPEAKRAYYDLAETIEMTGVTSVFHIHGISVSRDSSRIEVKGLKRLFAEDKKTEEGFKTYLIDYRILNSRFMIVNISEKES